VLRNHVFGTDPDPDADPDPDIFASDLQEIIKKIFFALLFQGTFTSFIKDKKSHRSQKTVGINVFLTIFA
jgi:hypothetical protein